MKVKDDEQELLHLTVVKRFVSEYETLNRNKTLTTRCE